MASIYSSSSSSIKTSSWAPICSIWLLVASMSFRSLAFMSVRVCTFGWVRPAYPELRLFMSYSSSLQFSRIFCYFEIISSEVFCITQRIPASWLSVGYHPQDYPTSPAFCWFLPGFWMLVSPSHSGVSRGPASYPIACRFNAWSREIHFSSFQTQLLLDAFLLYPGVTAFMATQKLLHLAQFSVHAFYLVFVRHARN